MCQLLVMEGKEPDTRDRRTWYGLRGRPRLPYYLSARGRRLKSLDEFEEPEWKDRVRWASDDTVTVRGVVRETFRWLSIFAIAAIVGGSFWVWLYGDSGCAELFDGFKVGWC